MAGRILNRREMRKQSDQVEQAESSASGSLGTVSPPKAPKVRKPRKPKAPPRMKALWCVYDGGMKEIALFDYNQRAGAEAKLAMLLDKHKGVYFLQLVKRPMPAAEPA